VSPFLLFDLTNRILCGRLDLSSLTTRCSNVVLRPGPMIQHLLFVLGCSTASASQTNENIGRAFTVLIGCSANAFTVGQPSKLPKSPRYSNCTLTVVFYFVKNVLFCLPSFKRAGEPETTNDNGNDNDNGTS